MGSATNRGRFTGEELKHPPPPVARRSELPRRPPASSAVPIGADDVHRQRRVGQRGVGLPPRSLPLGSQIFNGFPPLNPAASATRAGGQRRWGRRGCVPCTVWLWLLLHRLVQDRHELTLQGPMVPLSALASRCARSSGTSLFERFTAIMPSLPGFKSGKIQIGCILDPIWKLPPRLEPRRAIDADQYRYVSALYGPCLGTPM